MKKQTKTKIKTAWDLSYLYTSINDPQLIKDSDAVEKARKAFQKKYEKNTEYTKDAKVLLKAIKEYENIPDNVPMYYLQNLRSIDTGNAKLSGIIARLEEQSLRGYEALHFFYIALGRIDKKTQSEFLADPVLAPYKQWLKAVFDDAQFLLSEKEELIIGRLMRPASGMWVDGFQKLLSAQSVLYKGKEITLDEAIHKVANLPRKDRISLYEALFEKLVSLAPVAEMEINAVYTAKKISDELRGSTKPYERTVIGYQNDLKTVETLVDTVTEQYGISHKFYKLKAKMLGLKKLHPADRNVSLGTIKKAFTFESSVDLVRSGLEDFGAECVGWINEYLRVGTIDVYPKKGKRGGAYCWGAYGKPSIVFLNHTDDFNSVRTLAHELGHAFHYEYANRAQSKLNSEYTISTAEVASTFFENIAFANVYKTLSDSEKIVALAARIDDAMNTIFRQIAFFNLEKDFHAVVRSNGYVSHEELAEISKKHLKAYVGPAYTPEKNDGYYFLYVSHFRRFFYVYAYAYGALISRTLYEKYVAGELSNEQVKEVFKAGGSMSPEDIFKSVGINTKDKKFWEKGLTAIENDIVELEKLLKKKK